MASCTNVVLRTRRSNRKATNAEPMLWLRVFCYTGSTPIRHLSFHRCHFVPARGYTAACSSRAGRPAWWHRSYWAPQGQAVPPSEVCSRERECTGLLAFQTKHSWLGSSSRSRPRSLDVRPPARQRRQVRGDETAVPRTSTVLLGPVAVRVRRKCSAKRSSLRRALFLVTVHPLCAYQASGR